MTEHAAAFRHELRRIAKLGTRAVSPGADVFAATGRRLAGEIVEWLKQSGRGYDRDASTSDDYEPDADGLMVSVFAPSADGTPTGRVSRVPSADHLVAPEPEAVARYLYQAVRNGATEDARARNLEAVIRRLVETVAGIDRKAELMLRLELRAFERQRKASGVLRRRKGWRGRPR